MDDQRQAASWVLDMLRKIEALCLEVNGAMHEDLRCLRNQLQTVRANVRQFYSEVMLDLLPQSSEVAPFEVAPEVDVTSSDASKVDTNEKLCDSSIEKNAEGGSDELPDVSLGESLIAEEQTQGETSDSEDFFSCSSTLLSSSSVYPDETVESELWTSDFASSADASVVSDDGSTKETALATDVSELSESVGLSDNMTPDEIVFPFVHETIRNTRPGEDVIAKLRAEKMNEILLPMLFATVDDIEGGNDLLASLLTRDYDNYLNGDDYAAYKAAIAQQEQSEEDSSASFTTQDSDNDLNEEDLYTKYIYSQDFIDLLDKEELYVKYLASVDYNNDLDEEDHSAKYIDPMTTTLLGGNENGSCASPSLAHDLHNDLKPAISMPLYETATKHGGNVVAEYFTTQEPDHGTNRIVDDVIAQQEGDDVSASFVVHEPEPGDELSNWEIV